MAESLRGLRFVDGLQRVIEQRQVHADTSTVCFGSAVKRVVTKRRRILTLGLTPRKTACPAVPISPASDVRKGLSVRQARSRPNAKSLSFGKRKARRSTCDRQGDVPHPAGLSNVRWNSAWMPAT